MSKQEDDFFEVNNEVPFQPIQSIKIESVEVKEQDIHVRAKMVLARGSDN